VIYDEVIPTLENWLEEGIELGIISNFDSRIYPVLEELELRKFFQSITISSSVGAAKPEEKIFLTALAKHNCPPQKAWHIGDSLTEDYQGAIAAGLRAFLIKR
jgi:putative hydrolase of the HAD superfamily